MRTAEEIVETILAEELYAYAITKEKRNKITNRIITELQLGNTKFFFVNKILDKSIFDSQTKLGFKEKSDKGNKNQ